MAKNSPFRDRKSRLADLVYEILTFFGRKAFGPIIDVYFNDDRLLSVLVVELGLAPIG